MLDEGVWIIIGGLVNLVAAFSSLFFEGLPYVAIELAALGLGYGLAMSNAVDEPSGVLVSLSSTMNPIDYLQVLFLF